MNTATPIITSERLRYRPLREDDADLFEDLYANAEVMRHIAPALTPAAARRALDRALASMRTAPATACFLVFAPLSGDERLGIVGCPDLGAAPDLEIGVVLRPSAGGRGYGREGLATVAEQLFRRRATRSLWTRIAEANEAAVRMVESIGFRRCARPMDTVQGYGCWTLFRPGRAAAAAFGGHRNPAMAGMQTTGRRE